MTKHTELHPEMHNAWAENAACRGKPTRWWYPDKGGDYTISRYAHRICNACVVQEQCLQAGIMRNEDGIWGGMNLQQRRKLNRQLRIGIPLVCHECRTVFEKQVGQNVAVLYCSDPCRRRANNRALKYMRRFQQDAS